jgi:hypothetical protein
MFTISKFSRSTLPFLLAASVLTITASPAVAISNQAFSCGPGQAYYVTPAGVVVSGSDCTGDITIDSSARSIGDSAFASASGLLSVTIQSGVTSIGEAAFYLASSLNTITMPSTVQSIGGSAFRSTAFTSFTIPSGVNSIGDFAFLGMSSLTTLTVDPANTSFSSVGGVLFNKLQTQLIKYPKAKTGTSYVVPSSVTSISGYSFYDVTSLTSLTIPSGVTSFGSWIFESPMSGPGPLTSYTYCGSASLVGTGISGTPTSCSSAPGAPTIGTATATGTITATVSFTAPTSNGGSTILSYTATSSPGSITATLTQATSGTISVTGLSPSTSYTFTITALNSVGASSASAASNSITTSAALAAGIAPLFTSASSYDGRFTVQITDFDPAFTYSVSSNAGQASINATGLVTVTGLSPDQSVTVTVTTTRTGYASGSGSITGRSQVAPMLPTNKPTATISDTLITCTIGSYSAAPTSAAFSLFVDGKHISTNFSALGEFLPDWIIPWATSSTITRTASLTSANWAMSDAYVGKAITCSTLAYSKNAIGFTASAPLTAR